MTKYIETPTHVFEVHTEEVRPGVFGVRVMVASGWPLSEDEWTALADNIAKAMAAAGLTMRFLEPEE